MRLQGWLAAVAALVMGGSVLAQDANAAVPAMDITSMKGQATIEISGNVGIVAQTNRVKGLDAWVSAAPFYTGKVLNGESWNITEFQAAKMDLTFKVSANENAYLVTTLALNDSWNRDYDQDYLLKEVYFVFDNLWCSGLGVKFGKQALPFGYDKDELFVHPYLDGYGNSALTKAFNGRFYAPVTGVTGLLTGDGLLFGEMHPTTVDRTFAITPYYKLGDKLEFAFSLAQGERGIQGAPHNKSRDNLLFKTMAAQVFWTPVENLILQASAMTMYDRDGKNPPAWLKTALDLTGNSLKNRSYATSLSADYTFQIACRPFNVFAEWMHGWNTYNIGSLGYSTVGGYWNNSSSDDIHVGISYKFTDALKVLTQGEWLRQRQGIDLSTYGDVKLRETLWRWVLAAQYEMDSGMVFEAGYQYERAREKGTLNWASPAWAPSARDRASANTFFAGVHWSF